MHKSRNRLIARLAFPSGWSIATTELYPLEASEIVEITNKHPSRWRPRGNKAQNRGVETRARSSDEHCSTGCSNNSTAGKSGARPIFRFVARLRNACQTLKREQRPLSGTRKERNELYKAVIRDPCSQTVYVPLQSLTLRDPSNPRPDSPTRWT